MNKRLKQIRNNLGLSQEEFGKKIGIESRAHISSLENGTRNITDRIIKDTCREFGINEKWLRTGEGDMYYTPDDRYAINVAKLQRTDDQTIIRWVNAIAETSPDALREIEGFMKRLLGLDE